MEGIKRNKVDESERCIMEKKLRMFIFLVGILALMSASNGYGKEVQKKEQPEAVTKFRCLNCHKSYGSLNAPVLHGEEKEYLTRQLHSFKEGKRKNVFMNSVASQLTEKDIQQVTDYFSSFERCSMTAELTHQTPGNGERGKQKAAACAACHTQDNPVGAPFLNGQNGFYVAQQLRDMKYGRRSNPFMESVVLNLTEGDIWDVSAYFAEQGSCSTIKLKRDALEKITVRLPQSLLKRLKESERDKKLTADELVRIALIYYFGNE
jgi:cytochrome c553